MQKIILSVLLITFFSRLEAQMSIIPEPVSAIFTRDLPFQLTAKSSLGGNNSEARRIVTLFGQKIKPATGFSLAVGNKGDIQFSINAQADTLLGQEGYRMIVKNKSIEIAANQPAACSLFQTRKSRQEQKKV